MAQKLIKHIKQTDVYTSKYPYFEGQKFYTDVGMIYEDIGGYRCAILTTKMIQNSTTLTTTNIKLANTFVILYNTTNSTYAIYQYDVNGNPHEISNGTGSLPSGNNGDILINSGGAT